MSSSVIDRPRGTDVPTSTTETAPRSRRMIAPLGALVAVALLIAFVAAGASRMVEVTSPASAAVVASHHRAAGYGASLWPLGFTVHWNDGSAETHLWW